jgi:hypothetical protein
MTKNDNKKKVKKNLAWAYLKYQKAQCVKSINAKKKKRKKP